MEFLVVLEPCDDGYSVYPPALPGCASGGDTLADALHNAREAILLHLDGLLATGGDLPAPDDNPRAPDNLNDGDLVAVVSVDANKLEAFNKTTPVTITIPLIKKIMVDHAAKRAGMNRSEFLTHAATVVMEAKRQT